MCQGILLHYVFHTIVHSFAYKLDEPLLLFGKDVVHISARLSRFPAGRFQLYKPSSKSKGGGR